jgi:hypothetical protein
LDGEFGRLAKAEEASVRHRLAGTFFLAGRQREAEKLLDPFLCSNRLDSTPSAGAALKALANVKFLHYNENRIKPYNIYLKNIMVIPEILIMSVIAPFDCKCKVDCQLICPYLRRRPRNILLTGDS